MRVQLLSRVRNAARRGVQNDEVENDEGKVLVPGLQLYNGGFDRGELYHTINESAC